MKEYKGMAKTYRLVAEDSEYHKAKIKQSTDIFEFVKRFYSDDIEIYESFFMILLNRSHNTIGWQKISQGGVSGTVVDPKLVMKYAIGCLASSVALVHNHPGGSLKPSEQDLNLTRKIVNALKLVDICTLDHLIISKETYFSFADEGIL